MVAEGWEPKLAGTHGIRVNGHRRTSLAWRFQTGFPSNAARRSRLQPRLEACPTIPIR